jgi:hypothetical protein
MMPPDPPCPREEYKDNNQLATGATKVGGGHEHDSGQQRTTRGSDKEGEDGKGDGDGDEGVMIAMATRMKLARAMATAATALAMRASNGDEGK